MKFFFVTLMAMGMMSAFCMAEGAVVGDGDKRITLSGLDLGLMRVGYGKPLANNSLGGGPLSINGVTFKTGIATHAASDFYLALDGKAMSFQAICGIDDDSRTSKASVRFSIAADGKTVWTSPVMKGGMPGLPVQVPLAGVRLLRLSVDDAGDGISSDHADWADAAIVYRGEPPAAIAPPPPPLRWTLGSGHTTHSKIPDTNLPHRDFIEQGGRRAGQKVWYTINADCTLTIERDLVWPSLRILPNDTHGSFIRHYGAEAEPKITVDGLPLGPVKYTEAVLDGTLSFLGSVQMIRIKRVTFPCFEKYAALDRWTLVNSGSRPVTIVVAPIALSAEQKGPYGINVAEVSCDAPATTRLEPGKSLTLTVIFSARPKESSAVPLDAEKEEKGRREFISQLSDTLVLETPDPMLNLAFTFAKWRVAEAMNDTRGGLMLAPGNLRYYAATWCNDNVEYAGPFFPFLGEAGGNQGSLNAYRQYMAFMKPTYQRIPCSIVAEGTSTWGPFDRGDAAMYAYGASRFALALGDRAIAEELWKGIEWSLEYCKRQQTPEGVIASDKDELEGRLPAGKANLTTASLCYGALRSAADLARSLQRGAIATEYDQRANALADAIERYFGATVEGFSTYRYYDGNTKLRSWICMPLSMGIFTRNKATIDALFSPRMWTPDGLASQSGDKVFWDRSTLYALRAVFQAGETTKALDYLTRYTQRRLLGEHVPYAVEAFPEGGQGHLASESGLYCRIFIEGLFGILPTGLNTFRCTPRLPDNWPSMSLKHIKAFGGDFDMIVTRADAKLRVQVIQAGHSLFDQVITPGDACDVIVPQPDRNKK